MSNNTDNLFNTSSMTLMSGNFSKAREGYLEFISLTENIPPDQMRLSALINIGVCYKKQGLYDDALKFYLKALKLAKELKSYADPFFFMRMACKSTTLLRA